MSLDKSLKKAASLTRARNVLTRAERLAVLQEDERWTPEKGVYNLPKTKYRRLAPGQSGPKRPADRELTACASPFAVRHARPVRWRTRPSRR